MFPAKVSTIKAEGGYQAEGEWASQIQQLRAWRGPQRCMYTWELVALLWKHKSPRFDSCGVLKTRHGNNPRMAAGFSEAGTVWFSKPDERREVMTVPWGCIPYGTIRTATFNEEDLRWEGGELTRGWRSILVALVKVGYLMPCEELNVLIGEDTNDKCPRWARR